MITYNENFASGIRTGAFAFRSAVKTSWRGNLLGVLYRAAVQVVDPSGTGILPSFDLKLFDQFGYDCLQGDIVAQAPSSTAEDLDTTVQIGTTLSDRPVVLAGPHRLEFNPNIDLAGTLHIFMGDIQERMRLAPLFAFGQGLSNSEFYRGILGRGCITTQRYGRALILTLHWTSDANGDFEAVIDVRGVWDHIVTVPDPSVPPTNNYTLKVEDMLGVALVDTSNTRSSTAVQAYYPYRATADAQNHAEVVSRCPTRIKLSGCGNTKNGVVGLYILG